MQRDDLVFELNAMGDWRPTCGDGRACGGAKSTATTVVCVTTRPFDPDAKARALTAESLSWDTSHVVDADDGDIPVVDVAAYFRSGARRDLESAAAVLRRALERVGFYQLVGHGVEASTMTSILDASCRFHELPVETKQSILIDQPSHRVGAVGYMPVGARKLPTREKGNPNEAFLVKSDVGIDFDDNQWLPEHVLPGFRSVVEHYARTMAELAHRLLPLYAVALDLVPDHFDPGFEHPFWRLRMTHYPANPVSDEDLGLVGIPPHVDTTFMTLLLPDSPGLCIFSELRQQWILAPVVPDAFVVNSGELLRQWSNDRVLSTRHFARSVADASRYSVPFFYNASADYPMVCLPSCHGPGNPPKYPPISYRESQGVVQGE